MLILRIVIALIHVSKKVDAANVYVTIDLEESSPHASFQCRLRKPMIDLSNVSSRYINNQ